MLVLSRKPGQRIRIRDRTTGETFWIQVLEIHQGKTRLGFDSLDEKYEILREEIVPQTFPE